jgi:hypothetical protein
VGNPIVLEERGMRTMRALELGNQPALLNHVRVHHGSRLHEPWQHAAFTEVLERVPAFRVDRPEHAPSMEEHVSRRIAE